MVDGEFADNPQVEQEVGGAAERVSLRALLRGLFFAAAAVGTFGGLHLYVALRIIDGARLSGAAAGFAWATALALFVSIPLSFFLQTILPRSWAVALQRAVYLWMGFFPLLFSAVALADGLSFAVSIARGAPGAGRWNPGLVAIAFGGSLAALVWGMRSALGPPKVEHVAVPIEGVGQKLAGLRIVQISDLHVGETLGASWVRRVVDEVNRLEPDIVAITGDVADGSARERLSDLAPLSGLRASLGVFFVTGNHEHYSGADDYEALMAELGIDVLHNEHRILSRGGERLAVAGVTDFEGGRFSRAQAPRPDLALSGIPEGVPRILLAHQPRAASSAAPYGVDLQLSGHTHGGQIFPWMIFVRMQQPVLRGLNAIDGVRVYTHRGTGFWGPPVRVGASPEIACLTLWPAEQSTRPRCASD